MPRAFLVVMDSVGIGGAPDAGQYFNGKTPDTGANTVANIAYACARGNASFGRSGPLIVPTLDSLGLGAPCIWPVVRSRRGWGLNRVGSGG